MNPILSNIFGLSPTELALTSPSYGTTPQQIHTRQQAHGLSEGCQEPSSKPEGAPSWQSVLPRKRKAPNSLIDYAFDDFSTSPSESTPPAAPENSVPSSVPNHDTSYTETPHALRQLLHYSPAEAHRIQFEASDGHLYPTQGQLQQGTLNKQIISVQMLFTIESSQGEADKIWNQLDVRPFVIDPFGNHHGLDSAEQDDEIYYYEDTNEEEMEEDSYYQDEVPATTSNVAMSSLDRASEYKEQDFERRQEQIEEQNQLQKATIQRNVDFVLGSSKTDVVYEFQVHLYLRSGGLSKDHVIDVACFTSIASLNAVTYPVTRLISLKDELPSNEAQLFLASYRVDRGFVLSNLVPSIEECSRSEAEEDQIEEEDIPIADKAEIKENTTRGGRPEGPKGLLLTKLQREKLLHIRKKIRNKTKRDLRYVIQAEDLYPFFTIGRDEVAERLAICITLLKKICRKHGIHRWPNRKLIPTGRRLVELKKLLDAIDESNRGRNGNAAEAPEREALINEINSLRNRRLCILQNILSPEAFQEYLNSAPANALEPDWE